MTESTPSLNMDISEYLTETSPSNAEYVLGLENIQIQISENVHTTSNSEESGKEKEEHLSGPVDNVPNTEDENKLEMRRRIGVVEANDTAQAERRKARVLSKKFGEGMLHKKPSIFNKKL